MKKYFFNVKGMSCGHCEKAVESAVKGVAGVSDVKASAAKSRAVVQGNESVSVDAVVAAISEAGYSAESSDSDEDDRAWFSWGQFAGIAIAVGAVLLIVHQTLGLDYFPVVPSEASLGLVFVAGLLTSLHCVAMCGGINLSQCLSKEGSCAGRFSGVVPSTLYNGGRVVSYTITGALAGALGSAFDFSPNVKSGIMIVAGLFMIIMGLKFLGVIDRLPRIPFFSGTLSSRISAGKITPAIVGLLSGLMPCGPLQAMQLYALGTGGALQGALAMFVFAAGTFPLMFAIGALSSFVGQRFSQAMFKVGGVVIMVLALFMISNGLSLSGAVVAAPSGSAAVAVLENGTQVVRSTLDAGSYQPLVVQKGIPVRWVLSAKEEDLNGCNGAIIVADYQIQKRLYPGENIIEFVPRESGRIGFSCWMGMIRSSITIVDDVSKTTAADAAPVQQGGLQYGSCCGRCSGGQPPANFK